MLPRLRFVVAAAVIAALPWIVFNSGLVTDLPSSSIAEYSRQSSPASLAISDLRDARQMYLMSYVRRSRELEKLRELAIVPLSDWVAAPSGEPDLASSQAETQTTKIAALPAEAITPQPAALAEPKASEPAPQPAEPENAQPVSTSSVPNEPALEQNNEPAPSREPAPTRLAAVDTYNPREKNRLIEPASLARLPRARPVRTVRHAVRHHRMRYAAQPAAPVPNLFNGPPAGPTLSNDFAQTYGVPK